jgi:uncharacterized protein
MPPPGSPQTAVDLEALDAFLLSDRAPDDSMGLSDLDGFLTGIVVGPELILPSEWLPIIWGGGEPDFASLGEAQTIVGIIMARYNDIIAHLDAGPNAFDPVFWEGPNEEVIVTDWAAGFLDAVRLRPKAWEPLIQHRDQAMIIPLLLLGTEDEDQPPFGARPRSTEELHGLLAEGAEIIPECVARIRAFWREHAGHATPREKLGRGRPDTPATQMSGIGGPISEQGRKNPKPPENERQRKVRRQES